MKNTMEKLLNGKSVVEFYKTARDKWRDILADIDPTDEEAIAKEASRNQFWFEDFCDDKRLGQEIMVWVGICQYYTLAGFGEDIHKARAMYFGLCRSTCSIEIRNYAKEVAEQYKELTSE